ncbi:hypothetical protein U9M48_025255 [Paspalum notatum var. saurae]|uniref:Uncharacterized protein n=1 Tax=Paspalum notatum var. saurae TaxID=547442 RepID=A0AAQ3WX33_PASNO
MNKKSQLKIIQWVNRNSIKKNTSIFPLHSAHEQQTPAAHSLRSCTAYLAARRRPARGSFPQTDEATMAGRGDGGGRRRPRAVFLAFGTQGDVFPIALLRVTDSSMPWRSSPIQRTGPPVLAAKQVENISDSPNLHSKKKEVTRQRMNGGRRFGGGRAPTGTPSLAWSSVVIVASLLAGASIVHNIYKPDMVRPSASAFGLPPRPPCAPPTIPPPPVDTPGGGSGQES